MYAVVFFFLYLTGISQESIHTLLPGRTAAF